jgi:hypothetical protein
MVISHKILGLMLVTTFVVTFNGCSSSEESDEDIEASEDDIEEPENASLNNSNSANAEGNGEQFAEGQEFSQGQGQGDQFANEGDQYAEGNQYAEGEAMNNATEEDDLGANMGQEAALLNSEQSGDEFLDTTNQYSQQATTANAPMQNTGAFNQTTLTDSAPTNVPANVMPANGAMMPVNQGAAPVNGTMPLNASMTPPVNTQPMPMDGGIVRYVRVPKLDVFNQPTNVAPSNALEMGDHPVTWSEGQWSRMHDGRYVKSDGLTDQGIARPRKKNPWK